MRAATGHASYPGDVTESIGRDIADGRPFGPNYMGELMWPVDASYDAEANRTRVGFSLQGPA
jgi:hypothetical protein